MPDVATANAPGRINLIGEHTDYHEGYVLPATVALRTRVELRRRSDARVHAASTAHLGVSADYRLGEEVADGSWRDYVQAVTVALARRGIELAGFDVSIDSDVPPGAGLSSSAALLVALLRGVRTLLSLALDDREIALIAHVAETDFVNAPVGVMDQMVCSLGRPGTALFIDTRSLHTVELPLPAGLLVAVIASGITHRHAAGGYRERRRESFEAAASLGVSHLRDLSVADLGRLSTLPATLQRRARHVVTENARVLEAVEALRASDLAGLGRLFNASHSSLRDDYQVSTPEVDLLVEVAQRHPAVYGARMTGGGFGGAVAVALQSGSTSAAEEIAVEYRRVAGEPGAVLTTLNG